MEESRIASYYEHDGQISMFGASKELTCGSCAHYRMVCSNVSSPMYAKATEPDERCAKWQRKI